MKNMKLKNPYLVCFAVITCLAWMKTSLYVLNKILNPYKSGQSKSSQFDIAAWWARRHSGKLKYVLLWPSDEYSPFTNMAAGQDVFIRLNCPIINCFITANRTYFKDIRSFDFIALMGRELNAVNIPPLRAVHQKYIYFNMESSPNYPLEDPIFDGFFNWTMTYRLDSDIPIPYIQIRDMNGNIVGPKRNMEWVPEEPVDVKLLPADILSRKTQAAAIFYSNCNSLSVREEVIADLQKQLKAFGLEIDVFGSCGRYKCSRSNETLCNEMLAKNYFFYLSFENSFDIDYVTEKLLTAVQNNVVPVVYGGANYSRFLPPGSYLDASEMSPMMLANRIAYLVSSPGWYLQHFWWKKYYTYHNPIFTDNICNICTAMNNEKMIERTKVHKDFRRWWNIKNYV